MMPPSIVALSFNKRPILLPNLWAKIHKRNVVIKTIKQLIYGLIENVGKAIPELKASIDVAIDSINNTDSVKSADFSSTFSLEKDSLIMFIPNIERMIKTIQWSNWEIFSTKGYKTK